MREDLNTLVVVSSRRGTAAIDDLAESVSATFRGRGHTLAVVPQDVDPPRLSSACTRVSSLLSPAAAAGFHCNAGLRWATQSGWQFHQALVLSDSCLLTGSGLDAWAASVLERPGLGALGVGQARLEESAFQAAFTFFADQGEVGLPASPMESLADEAIFLTRELVDMLDSRQLLTPDSAEAWPGTYGGYMAWASRLCGYAVVEWGRVDRCLPPLYIGDPLTALPPPTALLREFLLFSDARAVPSYSEDDLREIMRARQGRTVRRLVQYGPTVWGPVDYETAEAEAEAEG